MYTLQIKRIYAAPGPDDGCRFLVDRLWPRGIKKETAALDGWFRGIAPSAELRKSFAHQPERFGAFRTAYLAELQQNPGARAFARTCGEELMRRRVTLLYAAKSETDNNAAVLKEWLGRQMEPKT